MSERDIIAFYEIKEKYFASIRLQVYHKNSFLAEKEIVCNNQQHHSHMKKQLMAPNVFTSACFSKSTKL